MNLSRLTLRNIVIVGLQQVALAASLFLLIVGWLHIPDANAFEVLISVVLVLLIAVVAGGGESAIMLRATGRPVTLRSLVPGTIAVILATVLWYATSLGVDHLGEKTGLWAGYLNSRAPASLRNLFSFEHLYQWFSWLRSGVCWVAAGLLAAAAFSAATSSSPVTGFRAILRSGSYGLSLLIFVMAESALPGLLMGWTPGHGLRLEALSLVARMLLVIVLNAGAIAFLLLTMARGVLSVQSVGIAEPVTSQLRTAEIP